MMTSNPETPVLQADDLKAARAQKQQLAYHFRKTFALADRLRLMADGSHWFVRFSTVEILEHWLLLISFTILGITGLLQRFANLKISTWTISAIFGDLDVLRTVHQAAAILFGFLCLFHLGSILTVWFVKRESGSMLYLRGDSSNLVKMIQYNLGLVKQRPSFDRFTIEEKLGYWALLIFAPVMGLTGLIQWFPTVVTRLLPVAVIPFARSIHSLTAILAIASVLTWHLYHTVLKERNASIFTGLISEQAMIENHPLEYQRIVDAYEKAQNLSKGK